MNFDEYQEAAHSTAVYPPKSGLEYTTLGLVSEAGEFAGRVKKVIRGDFPEASISKPTLLPFDVKAWMAGELGDILWYVAECAMLLGLSLEDVAEANLTKLALRKQSGTIKGSGEKR